MSRRKKALPIILSHDTQTGIVVFPNRKMGGRDALIVGLKRETPSGQEFDLKDIDWIKAVLHFGDITALRVTVDVLTDTLKQWEKEDGKNEQRKERDAFMKEISIPKHEKYITEDQVRRIARK